MLTSIDIITLIKRIFRIKACSRLLIFLRLKSSKTETFNYSQCILSHSTELEHRGKIYLSNGFTLQRKACLLTSHSSSFLPVPEYEVINLHSRVRRSADDTEDVRTVHLHAFDTKRVLRLRRNKHLARNVPMFYAEHDPSKGEVVVKPAPGVSRSNVSPFNNLSMFVEELYKRQELYRRLSL